MDEPTKGPEAPDAAYPRVRSTLGGPTWQSVFDREPRRDDVFVIEGKRYRVLLDVGTVVLEPLDADPPRRRRARRVGPRKEKS